METMIRKEWGSPKGNVQEFTPQEYIAGCGWTTDIFGDLIYADVNKDSYVQNAEHFENITTTFGDANVSNGKPSDSDYLTFVRNNNSGTVQMLVPGYPPSAGLKNFYLVKDVNIYRNADHGATSGIPYSNYVFLGTYDLLVRQSTNSSLNGQTFFGHYDGTPSSSEKIPMS